MQDRERGKDRAGQRDRKIRSLRWREKETGETQRRMQRVLGCGGSFFALSRLSSGYVEGNLL